MAHTHLNEESIWLQWQTRRRLSRARLNALQLMATSGVIRPIHVECRYDTNADRMVVYSGMTHDPDNVHSHSTTSFRGLESWQAGSLPFAQRLRDISEGIFQIQRQLLADLQWRPDKT